MTAQQAESQLAKHMFTSECVGSNLYQPLPLKVFDLLPCTIQLDPKRHKDAYSHYGDNTTDSRRKGRAQIVSSHFSHEYAVQQGDLCLEVKLAVRNDSRRWLTRHQAQSLGRHKASEEAESSRVQF